MARAEQGISVTPLSEKLTADKKQVEDDLSYTKKRLVDLLPRPFEKYQAFKVRRGKDVKGEGPFDRLEVEMLATKEEVYSAPPEVQALLLDLGVRKDDEMAIEVSIGKKRNKDPKYAEIVYGVTLMPTTYRPDLFGFEFGPWQFWLLKSGSPFEGNHPAEYTNRSHQINHAYDLLRNGLVYDSHEVGTHASYTEYEHMPHPALAAMRKGVADWIVNLIDARMK